MFTGIIQAIGRIAAVEARRRDRRLTVRAGSLLRGVRIGDSIAVAGVCLTVAAVKGGQFVADVSAETLACTTAGAWKAGSPVNLEKALTAGQPLGGHLVSGHVDGVGRVAAIRADGRSRRFAFAAPRDLAHYIARKGSIAVDGVSLTVNDVAGARFGVSLIPVTLQDTTLGGLKVGDTVNLEVDLIARYLERLETRS